MLVVILLKPLGKYHAIEAYMLPIITSKEIFLEKKLMKNWLDYNEAKLTLDEWNISYIFICPTFNWIVKIKKTDFIHENEHIDNWKFFIHYNSHTM